MIKKYRYLLIALLLVLLTPIITSKIDDTTTVFNEQQGSYVNFVEGFLIEINEVENKYPINLASFKTQGERYFYNALTEREKVLDTYSYTKDTIPDEYVDIHRKLVEFITLYREGINRTKEGILIINTDIIDEGISKIVAADELLVKIQEDFILKQAPSKN